MIENFFTNDVLKGLYLLLFVAYPSFSLSFLYYLLNGNFSNVYLHLLIFFMIFITFTFLFLFLNFKRIKKISTTEFQSMSNFTFQYKYFKNLLNKIKESKNIFLSLSIVFCFLPFFFYSFFTKLLASNSIDEKSFVYSFICGFTIRFIISLIIIFSILN